MFLSPKNFFNFKSLIALFFFSFRGPQFSNRCFIPKFLLSPTILSGTVISSLSTAPSGPYPMPGMIGGPARITGALALVTSTAASFLASGSKNNQNHTHQYKSRSLTHGQDGRISTTVAGHTFPDKRYYTLGHRELGISHVTISQCKQQLVGTFCQVTYESHLPIHVFQ